MNVGVIGAGKWGKCILRTLASSPSTITHIAYGGSDETERFLHTEYEGIPYTKNYLELLKNPAVDAVCIATPIATHAEIAKMALNAHKHVFVEKPLSASTQIITELYQLADTDNLALFTGYLYLFDPAVQILSEELQSASNIELNMVWNKNGTFDTSLHENLLVHDLALVTELIGIPHTDHITKNERDVFEGTFIGDRGTAHISIDRTRTEKQKTIAVKVGERTYQHMFVNENLLAIELNAFFQATETGSASNKKRKHIDTTVANILTSLQKVT